MWEINWQGNWGHIIKGTESQIVSRNFLLRIKGSHWRFLSRKYCDLSSASEDWSWITVKWGVIRQKEKFGADCGDRWERGSVTTKRECYKKWGLQTWELRRTLRYHVNLWPMIGSGHKGLNEYACYANFPDIYIFHFSSVVSNALVKGEKEQTSNVSFNFTILSKFL